MKKLFVMLAAMAAALVASAASLVDGYVKSDTVKLGQWNWNFDAVKAYADANNVPLLMFYGSTTCGYCDGMINNGLNSTIFRNWVKEHPICMVFQDKSNLTADAAKNFVKQGAAGPELPYMKIYWKKSDGSTINVAFAGRSGYMPSKVGAERGEQLVNSLNLVLADYLTPKTPKSVFVSGRSEYNRLECEDGTKSVMVPIMRTVNTKEASEDTLYVGTATQKIKWAAGQTTTNIAVAVSGKTVTLKLKNSDGDVTDTMDITYVKRENSAANPLWVGEKFGFGEWTCDIDGATNLVAATDGNAYTLISIQGSMWCPDCANTDRNFLDLEDEGTGKNRFQQWAKAHNVVLVTMDIPNYKGPTVADCATPTLFTTNAYATTLARVSEYPQSGADGSLTNAIVRSGLGYISRKGISEAAAAATLKKFHDLAVTNTDKGGFHRPEDGNKFRTGVPIFVLLRKDGTVAARFTRFAAVSPMAADRDNFDNYLKRFDEMLAIATPGGAYEDASEIENNYPGEGAIPFAANGGSVTTTLCNADFQDAFVLSGVGGNAIQEVRVTGAMTSAVAIQFWKKAEDGTYAPLGTQAIGNPADGITLTHEFTQSGNYYLLVKGNDIREAGFAAQSDKANNFQVYTVMGATVLVPQQDQASANAPAGSNSVKMRLVKDEIYRFSGVHTTENSAVLELLGTPDAYAFFKAKVSGDVDVVLSAGLGGQLFYQIWEAGEIGFKDTEMSVPESVNDLKDDWVEFKVVRTGGKSGRVKAVVAVDDDATELESERYVVDATNEQGLIEFAWADGEDDEKTVRVKILDDIYYDGDKDIVFKVLVAASDAGDVEVAEDKGTFTLTVEEDDRAEPGRGMITRTEPDYGKKGTVYFRASEGAKIWAQRIEAWDGLVGAELTSSVVGTTFETENPRDIEIVGKKTILWWSSREKDEKYVKVGGIVAGKSARIQLKSYDKFKTVSASNTVTVVAVADDAPYFAAAKTSFDVNRYVTVAELGVGVKGLTGGKVTLTKLSGSIPAGISAAWDATKGEMTFTGTPTGKAGVYEATYQVVETRNGKKVPGLTTAVRFALTDPTDLKTNPEGANPAVAAVSSRTFKSIPVVVGDRLLGTLQITIPKNGKLSAKYTGAIGSVSFSSKSWGAFEPETKRLSAALDCRIEGYRLHVAAMADGSLGVTVTDPDYVLDIAFMVDWKEWSKDNPATDWEGYYTVACPTVSVDEMSPGIAPRGCGYLTLKMNTSSAVKSGTVTWAGMLPNGTAVSGSALLVKPTNIAGDIWANLPIFKQSLSDVFSSYVRILANAADDGVRRCVLAAKNDEGGDMATYWDHEESVGEACYSAVLDTMGSYYDKTEDLGSCCQEFHLKSILPLTFDTSKLGWLNVGEPIGITPVNVEVLADKMRIVSGEENPSKVTLSLTRSTGIVSGRANLAYTTPLGVEKTMSVSYKGVVLTGWGEGCGCHDYSDDAGFRPFVNGSFYFTDKIPYLDSTGKERTKSVKRGGEVSLEGTVVPNAE